MKISDLVTNAGKRIKQQLNQFLWGCQPEKCCFSCVGDELEMPWDILRLTWNASLYVRKKNEDFFELHRILLLLITLYQLVSYKKSVPFTVYEVFHNFVSYKYLQECKWFLSMRRLVIVYYDISPTGTGSFFLCH